MTTFDPANILPDDHLPETHPQDIDDKLLYPIAGGSQPAFGAPAVTTMSATRSHPSVSPPSVFDDEPRLEQSTEPTTALGSGSPDEPASYDLKPPPPSVQHDNVEALSQRLWSADHLNTILFDPTQSGRFTNFLNQYRPQHVPILTRYMETRKAISAIEYANALAEQIVAPSGHRPYIAAHLDDRFEAKSRRIVEELVEEALPAYITNRLCGMATETLVKEVTGNGAPVLRELIPSLAEVYCVSDPSLPDNPIVYASEEFYNTSQYGREYVIGRNCRFLQGPKTSNATVKRMVDALTTGQEICETILNYRRDGSPFMNLLMIAPLYDNKGTVRYFLGCQIDVSSLIEGGRGLESFSQLLAKDRAESRFGDKMDKDPKHVLGELGSMFTDEEVGVVGNRSSRQSRDSASAANNRTSQRHGHQGRRILGMDDTPAERALWPHPSLGPSGRLPGVYQNYLLVRPYPSLRITFTSPALRIPGLLQTKFLDRVGGPQHVREGIIDALSHGQGVTAKISWLTNSPLQSNERERNSLSLEGKPRWIHCTPLLGSDEQVGVWMVVMVENEEVTGTLNRRPSDTAQALGSGSQAGAADKRFTGNKLYAEYLRREGGSGGGGSQRTQNSIPIRGSGDHFRDF